MQRISHLGVGILVVSAILAGSVEAGAGTMILVSKDKASPVIVIGSEASASEKFAAEEMAAHLYKMTCRDISIVDDGNIPEGRLIIAIGRNVLTESIDTTGLGCEQYIIDVQPEKVLIIGGRREAQPGLSARDSGTLYGVYEFLEGLGVRWYRPEPWGEHVPQESTISLQVGKTVSPPPSYPLFRKIQSGGMANSVREGEDKEQAAVWLVRNRMNVYPITRDPARDAILDAKLGGQEHYEDNHMHHAIIPPSEYFESHPEYFALVKGERVSNDLCLGNPELQSVFAKNLIAKAKANPHLSALSVEPNDCLGHTCECERCKAMDLPANTRPGGDGSNRIASFSSKIAGMVAKEAPWVKILWLAYSSHTAAPTNVQQLEPNTIVMPAPIGEWSDWRKGLTELSGSTFDLPTMLGEWAALKPFALMAWEYFDGYGWPGPLPITHTVADRWRNYRNMGVKGIYNHSCTSWGPQGLDRYMSIKLAWNPDLDVHKELNLYYTNYYGPAAKPMKAYHERLFKALETAKYQVMTGGRGMHLIFTPALVKELGKSMGDAQALVEGQPLYERRLRGVWAGYEFSRRVSEILVLKKKYGVPVSAKTGNEGDMDLPPEDMNRPEFIGGGSYLRSVEAEKAFGDLIRWMRTMNTEEWVFDMFRKRKFTEDAAETIIPKGGASTCGAVWFSYLPRDLLMNWMHMNEPEEIILKDF